MGQDDIHLGIGEPTDLPKPAPAPEKPERPLSLNERKALNWFKAHSPTGPSPVGLPKSEYRAVLMVRGLIEIDPQRKRYDPISYVITPKGLEALRGHHD
jgi:hypothetical protein